MKLRMACLDVTGLSEHFGRKEALRSIRLTVGAGEVVGLIGPNGSGRSTLMHAAAGIVTPDAGEMLINGRAHTEQTAKDDLGVGGPAARRLPLVAEVATSFV